MRRSFLYAIVAALAVIGCRDPHGATRVDERASAPAGPPSKGPASILRLPNGWNNGFSQDLIALPLASDPIGSSRAVGDVLRANADARAFFHYIVGCALPRGAKVVVSPGGEELSFDGLIGLAPDWATAPCDEACQEWVSACILSRTNAYGIPVLVSARGDHPALADFHAELTQSPVEEGAFYGNLFGDDLRAYACRGRGYDPLYMTVRVCSQPGNACGIQNVGPCGAMDGDTGAPSLRHACEAYSDELGGAYLRCRNRASVPGGDDFPAGSRVYTRVVTIYTPQSSFGNDCHLRDPAQAPATPPDAGVTPDGGSAGRLCTSDDDCNSESPPDPASGAPAMICNVQGPELPFCTATCIESAVDADEEDQCGGADTTCLSSGDGPNAVSRCTRTCVATGPPASPRRCPAAQVCTGFWFTHQSGGPDTAGCAPYCRDDSDCIRGARCNPRRASCGLDAEDPGLRADGEPCELTSPTPQCRGICLIDGRAPDGICASLIHMGRTAACPDTPDLIKAAGYPRLDQIGLCTFRACEKDADCTPPLRCQPLPNRPNACRH